MKLHAAAMLASLMTIAGCSEVRDVNEPSPRSAEVFQVGSAAPTAEPVYAGTLRARQRSDLSFLQTGQIIKMNKELGESFNRGDILARLDGTELALAVEERQANLVDARAELTDAKLGLKRLVALEASGSISTSVLDSAIARFDGATARVTSISKQQYRTRISFAPAAR